MECHQVRTKVSAYIDRELDPASTADIESHLAACADCRDALADFHRIDDSLRSLQRLDLGPEFTGHVVTLAAASDEATRPSSSSNLSEAFHFRVFQDVRSFFGLTARPYSPSLELAEFNDFPPLSIGFLYFTILGEHEKT